MSWPKAFGWKKTGSYQVMELASNLGLERRQNFRIRYPDRGAIGDLPTATYAGNVLKIQNISGGGCCLIDPEEILGPAIGHEITLHMHWLNESQFVHSRIVSRVEARRHIQFLDLPEKNQHRIRQHIEPAFRGSALRKVESAGNDRLTMEACEIWVSILEDSITLFDHPHLIGSCLLRGQDYLFYRDSMPVLGKDRKKPVSNEIFDSLVLFLANVPNPSSALSKFLAQAGSLGEERFR